MDPHSRAAKKNTSHGNEVLPQDTTHLIQRPSYQPGSPCQDPAKRSQLKWFGHVSRSGLAKTILQYKGKKTKQTGKEVGRQLQGMDRPGVRQVPAGSGDESKLVVKSSVVPKRPPWLRDR